MSDLEPNSPSSPADLAPKTDSQPKVAAGTSDDDRFECRACGYTYDPNKGDPQHKIIAGTPFTDLWCEKRRIYQYRHHRKLRI
jgi:hypothetical protein